MVVMNLSKVQYLQLFRELKSSKKTLGSSEILQGSYSILLLLLSNWSIFKTFIY